ncbi:AAEL011553-PA [Aedes aegypti]|uniref:AAEL011553-PA n=2 Tax=Aedes aegypti TaxID=7159 RepID=A0A1S4FTJ9_AEDAE|nr:trypsin-3 [Aedes aegypti]EAT36354.1 AAEL011553-PA [Aedes aegypti]
MTSVVTVVLFLGSIVASALAAPRIVGGKHSTIEQHPYQISLRRGSTHTCGGSIISADAVLTAAHCVYYTNVEPTDFSIRAGSTLRNEGGQLITVAQLFIHPEYDDWTLELDIAVLKLSENFIFGAGIQPVALPNSNLKISHGAVASIAGWGSLYYQGPSVLRLQEVTVPIVENAVCGLAYQNFGPIWPFHLCAGAHGIDACQGDSGGPLVMDGTVIGVVSWGYGCAFNGYPTVYTRVSEFTDFIRQHM